MRRTVYCSQFFAHYRVAVLERLLADDRIAFWMASEPDSSRIQPSIASWDPTPTGRFVPLRMRRLPRGLWWQAGSWRLALSPSVANLIFVADTHFLSTWVTALLARLSGKRVFFWAHAWRSRSRGLSGLMRKVYFRLANAVLLYGRRAHHLARLQGFPPRRLHVIYNALDYRAQKAARERIDEADCRALRAELFGDPAARVVICTTRLTPQRRLDQLLDAAARLADPPCILLVGDGPERQALEDQAATSGLKVHFYGACYDERRLGELIMAARACVAPGKVGLTAMHALAFGVPVITHAAGDDQMPEWEAIVPGRTGDLFPRGDLDALAVAIDRWCGANVDREAVRHDCIAVIERFYNPEHQARCIVRALAGDDPEPVPGPRIQGWELDCVRRSGSPGLQ